MRSRFRGSSGQSTLWGPSDPGGADAGRTIGFCRRVIISALKTFLGLPVPGGVNGTVRVHLHFIEGGTGIAYCSNTGIEIMLNSFTFIVISCRRPFRTIQKKTDKEHILDNPDTYTGPMETTQSETYVYDEGTSRIVEKEIDLVPGLYKLIDEGCVNCRDHAVRCAEECDDGEPGASRVTQIRVDVEGGLVTMCNDGTGIDVEKHPEHGVWIPELIFGHLRTSTNYDKSKKRIVGGKNGFGFKLVLIWSKWGRVKRLTTSANLSSSKSTKTISTSWASLRLPGARARLH